MTAEQRDSELAAALLRLPEVTLSGRGFGSSAPKVRGKMFATLSSQGAFVVN